MSSTPPPSPEPAAEREEPVVGARQAKRPKWLVVALVAALVFGAGCCDEGVGRLALYRGENDPAVIHAQIRDEGDRAHAESLYQRFVDAANAQRGRALPLAAATFVLGAALLALAARGLGGRSNTRSALIQVVAVQAIVVAGGFYATRATRDAELDWKFECLLLQQREHVSPEKYAAEVVPMMRGARRVGPTGWLVFRTVASALIVFALTRRRSREFFESASAGPLSDG